MRCSMDRANVKNSDARRCFRIVGEKGRKTFGVKMWVNPHNSLTECLKMCYNTVVT